MKLTTFFDVDNTLLDNDRAKVAMNASLAQVLGDVGAEQFWEIYEKIRAETGSVSIPRAMARLDAEMEVLVRGGDLAEAQRRARRDGVAAVIMGMPFAEYVFSGSAAALAHAQALGNAVVFSEGDATYQPSKIWRSGLTQALNGHVLVYERKRERLVEAIAAYPADHWVFVDDKAVILSDIRKMLGDRVTTVWVRQGGYAADGPSEPHPDITIEQIGEFASLDRARLTGASR